MRRHWSDMSVAALIAAMAVAAAGPALARDKQKPVPGCVDRPYQFSWRFLLPGQAEPQPNGCSPPVYAYGKFVGQDPDRNIRFQLQRDPGTGYSANQN